MVKSMSTMLRADARFVAVLSLCVSAAAWAGPQLLMEEGETVVHVPIGSVVTNTLWLENSGDSTLAWTLTDCFEGKAVEGFANPWTSARSMRYDTTRDCLWLSYYYDSNVKQVRTSDGAIVATKNMGTACARPYGIEVDNGYLWATDYSNARFVKFNLSNMNLADTVPFPSGWSYAYGIGIGDGQFYATHNGDQYDICRLNPSTGAIQATYDNVARFYYYYNHISYGDGAVWFGSYTAPKNRIIKFDPSLGRVRSEIELPGWYEGVNIFDQSVLTNGQAWALTYRHDYDTSGQSKYWIHRLCVDALQRLSESVEGGSIAASHTSSIDVVFDGNGAASAIHRAGIKINSNGGTKEKPYVFVVHSPGANGAPTANAGPDQTMDISEPSMDVTLNGSGSTDPNGDELVYEWLMVDGSMVGGKSPTVELGPGVHDIRLTVSDLRGGTDTDTVRITLSAPDIEVADVFAPAPEGSGPVTALVTVVNNGDQALDWSVSETLQLGQDDVLREFEVNWVSSYSTYGYPRTMTYDATRDCLWVGYYYDDEIGKLNPNTGAEITTKALGSAHRVYALDMDGADLWIADYNSRSFKSFNPDSAATIDTISAPGSWTYGPSGLARDSGQFYAVERYAYEFCRLNPSTGGIQATHATGERFYYTVNHIDAIDGTVWYSPYDAPRNRLLARDGTTGNLLQTIEIDGWDTSSSAYIYDLSFAGTNTQCWLLTYNAKSDGKRWAHLVDLAGARGTTKSQSSGTVAAGSSATFEAVMDLTGLPIGLYPVKLTFASNDPDEPIIESTLSFVVHEDAPNNPPTADAGPDQHRTVFGATAPIILELNGGGSSDPDGDPLKLSWTWTDSGEPVETGTYGLVNLGPGSHGLTLIVEDYRGGLDTDEMILTVEQVPPEGWRGWHGTLGNGQACETNENWIQNWPPRIDWVVPGVGGGLCPAVSEGLVYCSDRNSKTLKCFDAVTGELKWSRPVNVVRGTPTVDDRFVYVLTCGASNSSRAGNLHCFDKITGLPQWVTENIGGSYDTNEGPANDYTQLGVLGDLVFCGKYAVNRNTGNVVWSGSRSVHWKPVDWQGKTYMMNGGNGYLYDPATGISALDAGPNVRNGEGWYRNTQTHGTNAVWTIDEVWAIGGSKLSDFGTVGVVTYTQPVTIGNDGYFVAGGHNCGGPVYHVDMMTGAKTGTGVSMGTAIAVANKAVGDRSGDIVVVENTVTGLVARQFEYDVLGGISYSDAAYADQRLYMTSRNGLTCLNFGPARPDIDIRPGQWDAREKRAVFAGHLVNDGGLPASVSICWGLADGGTNVAAWDHVESLGVRSAGGITASVTSAEADRVYFYRCLAQNSRGVDWTDMERVDTYSPQSLEGSGGVLLHWPMDHDGGDVVTDVSGNSNHGALTYAWHWTNGVIGNALAIDHSRTRAVCFPLSAALRHTWSLSLWVKRSSDGGIVRLTRYPDGVGSYFTLGWTSGKLFTYRTDSIGYRTGVLSNGWHHVAVVRKGSTTSLYVDGALAIEPSLSWDTLRYLSVGGDGSFIGCLDDLRFYTRALVLSEIRALSAMDTSSFVEPTATVGNDNDAEESAGGTVTLNGTELNLGEDAGGSATVVGLRFEGLNTPQGATILGAQIQLGSGDTATGGDALFEIRAQAMDDAPAFTASANDLSSRAVTSVAVPWPVADWSARTNGPAQCAPNVGGLVQAVVDRSGWSSGNAIAFLVTGSGRRSADAADKSGGLKASLAVQWTDQSDLDGDLVPDYVERSAGCPGTWSPADDPDGDGDSTWTEYIAGTDAGDPASKPVVRLRSLPDGRVVAEIDGKPAEPPHYAEGLSRYYSLLYRDALPGPNETGTVRTLWLEDFSLANGTTNDAGDTAWSSTYTGTGNACVSNGVFLTTSRGSSEWLSEPIALNWQTVTLLLDLRVAGLPGNAETRVLYQVDDHPQVTLAEFSGNFNNSEWLTLSSEEIRGISVRIIVQGSTPWAASRVYLDNVRVTAPEGPPWPCVPGFSNVLVETECTLSHTNSAPGKTGFYRLKVGLE